MKVSPTTKSSSKTDSVTNVVTLTTYVNNKEVCPDKSQFKVGKIVSINIRELDGYRFRNRDNVPAFYVVVEGMILLDVIGWGETKDSFVSSGEYEWVDKRKSNLMTVV